MKVLFVIFVGFFAVLNAYSQSSQIDPTRSAERFDSYVHRIPWQEEAFHLDNFAIYLTRNPEMIGYIGFYVAKNDSFNRAKARVNRAKAYLIKQHGINKGRIVITYAGKTDNFSTTILQPLKRNAPPPDFKP